jgi:hypothetical protein
MEPSFLIKYWVSQFLYLKVRGLELDDNFLRSFKTQVNTSPSLLIFHGGFLEKREEDRHREFVASNKKSKAAHGLLAIVLDDLYQLTSVVYIR